MSEKSIILLFSALLAGACTIPEGTTATGADASLPDITIEAPDVEPISHYPHCVDHFTCCHESSLGRKYDEPDKTRRHFCFVRCNDKNDMRGRWPDRTHAGKDCRWWRPQYGTPEDECAELAP